MKKYFIPTAVIIFLSLITSCVKEEFDAPPTGGTDPVVSGTRISIASLKATYVPNTFTQVAADVYIAGTVIADDQSGNFYKEVVLQDSTGGISILIDQSDYYTDFPAGRKVFVKCRGLYLNDYNDLVQLGGYIDYTGSYPSLGRIPLPLISQYLVKGSYYNNVTPTTVTLSTIGSSPQNTLVKIYTVEFICGTAGFKTWADAVLQNDINLTITDCSGSTLTVRSSGFSSFAGTVTPAGNGSITGVLQVYGATLQLKIRDLDDVNMDGPRCNASAGVCIYNDITGFMTIDSVRKLWSGTTVNAPTGRKIKAVVISDIANGNVDSKNLIVQDSTAGIVVRFLSPVNIPMGSLVVVDIGGQQVTDYFGLLELNNIPNANVTVTGTCAATVNTATISDILTNPDKWESRLVNISNATLSGSGTTWGDLTTIADATGSADFYTKTSATFFSEPFPAGQVNVHIVVSAFSNAPEIVIRNLCDLH